jgi:hypothetical protein
MLNHFQHALTIAVCCFFAAGAVLSKKLACTHPGDQPVTQQCTLPSLTTLNNNNQTTMVTQEDVVGNSGAIKVGKGR